MSASPETVATPEPILVVDALVKRYPDRSVNAIDGLSFAVRPGEVFGLLGPNGAGKTTTIGVLTTRVHPSSGSGRVAGVDVVDNPVAAKAAIAVVPQGNNLDRSLTARQNLIFHAAYHGVRPAEAARRADALLRQFGLEGRGSDRVDRYSGGMAQRLMIARALMHQPRVLFLDEPTTGLDPQARLFVWDRVRELNREGLSVVLTTHDMREAEELCHRVAIMDHGRLLALDTPDGLRRMVPGKNTLSVAVRGVDADPAEPRSADLAARLKEIPGVAEVEREGASGIAPTAPPGGPPGSPRPGPSPDPGSVVLRLYGEGDPLLIGAVARVVAEAGLEVLDIHRAAVSLEDVFIHLTGRGLR